MLANLTNSPKWIRVYSTAYMQMINEMCSDLLSDTRLATLRVPEHREQTVLDHYGICDAIAAGDADLAAQRMRDHLTRAHTVLTETSTTRE